MFLVWLTMSARQRWFRQWKGDKPQSVWFSLPQWAKQKYPISWRDSCFLYHFELVSDKIKSPLQGTIGTSIPSDMATSSNGNIFRVTGPLGGKFNGQRWIPRTKASDAELRCFLRSAPEQTLRKPSRRRWFETPSRSPWRHCNDPYVGMIPTGVFITSRWVLLF